MKIPKIRTFNRPLTYMNDSMDVAERMKETTRPHRLLRKMAQNPDYKEFQALCRKVSKGDVRFNFLFPEYSDTFTISIADRKNPTTGEALVFLRNLFVGKKKRIPLPTMTHEECKHYFKTMFKKNYPIKIVEIDPDKPYAEKIATAVREFANERLFGTK